MKIMEKFKGKARNNKRMKLAGAAVVLIGIVVVAYVAGAAKGLFPNPLQRAPGGGDQTADGIKRPERNADIVGLVESVSGNEVKIMKLDAAIMPGTNRPSGNGGASEGMKPGQMSGNRQDRQQRSGRDGQKLSESGSAARTAMIAELKKKSLGEEIVTVPVGIEMIKRSSSQPTAGADQGGKDQAPRSSAEVQASFSDLTVDKMVTIWLNSQVTDKKVAEFVSIEG